MLKNVQKDKPDIKPLVLFFLFLSLMYHYFCQCMCLMLDEYQNIPAMDSGDPKQSEIVDKRFINAAVFCMSCCLSSHNIIFKASAKTSP